MTTGPGPTTDDGGKIVLDTSVFIDYLRDGVHAESVSGLAENHDHAGIVFRSLYGNATTLRDRLGPMNDVLIALTARQIGATVVTSNADDFARIASAVSGLVWRRPA